MKIIDSRLTPGTAVYSIICFCGFPFSTAADNRKRVKCPNCRREAALLSLIKDWKATPEEKMSRLKEIAAKARELYKKWLDLPELERGKGEGKEMGAQLNDYYAEAKGIMSTIAPRGKEKTA